MIELLSLRSIVHAEEHFLIREESVQVTDSCGKLRECPLEVELVVFCCNQKIDVQSEEQQVGACLLPESTQLDVKFIVKAITDSRKQKLSQQGIKLNV